MKKEILSYVLIILAVVLIRTFIATPVIVSGSSMYPTLEEKDVLILKKYDKEIERFDVVVFNYNNSKLIKRVIGLPGESVTYKNGKLYINDQELMDRFAYITDNYEIKEIPIGYYFVLGDNRRNSSDSRTIGLVSIDDINGITDFSLWPLKKFN